MMSGRKLYLIAFLLPLLALQSFGQTKKLILDSLPKYNKYRLPSISLAVGSVAPQSDVGNHLTDIWTTARFNNGLNVGVEQRIGNTFSVSLNGLMGTLSQNDNRPERHRNFKNSIKQGELDVIFNFDNDWIIHKKSHLGPYIKTGIGYLTYNPMGDLKNEDNKSYYFWEDGTIRDQQFDPEYPQNGMVLHRDYKFETTLDSNNLYKHHSLIIPLGGGVKIKFSDKFEGNISCAYYFTQTDYIDNVGNKPPKMQFFDRANDAYLFTSFGIQFNLSGRSMMSLANENWKDINFKDINKLDSDGDGFADVDDQCPDTPQGVKVDSKGCPIDSDGDGIADYLDKEPNTPKGNLVDENGVTINLAALQTKYENDSLRFYGYIISEKDTTIQRNFDRSIVLANNFVTPANNYTYNDKIIMMPGNNKYNSYYDKSKIKATTSLDKPANTNNVNPNYLVNDNTNNTIKNNTNITNNNTIANNNTTNNLNNNNTSNNNTHNNVNNNTNNNVNNNANNTIKNNTNAVIPVKPKYGFVNSTADVKGIVYRVQISSEPYSNRKNYLKSVYKITEEVFIDKYQNQYKYSIGTFNNYKDASNLSKTWRSEKKVNTFVIAFKDGERLEVRAAMQFNNEKLEE